MSGFWRFAISRRVLDQRVRLGGEKRFTSQRLNTGFHKLYVCATDNPTTPIAFVYKGSSEIIERWTIDEAKELVGLLRRVVDDELEATGRAQLVGVVSRSAGPDVRVEMNRRRTPVAISHQSTLRPLRLKLDRHTTGRLIAFLAAAVQVALSPQDAVDLQIYQQNFCTQFHK